MLPLFRGGMESNCTIIFLITLAVTLIWLKAVVILHRYNTEERKKGRKEEKKKGRKEERKKGRKEERKKKFQDSC